MFGTLLDLVNIVISVCLPLIATYKALHSVTYSTNASALQPLLIYWLVYGLLATAESRVAFILQYVPFIGLVRIYLSLWLVLPQTKGADYLYFGYIEPFLVQHEDKVEIVVKCADPREFIKVVSGYFGVEINLSRFSVAKSPEESAFPSYLDHFVERFTTAHATNARSASFSADGGLVESLLGVVKSFPLSTTTSFSTTSQDKSAEGVSGLASSGSQSSSESITGMLKQATAQAENNDFDVVGKDDLVNFVENSKSPDAKTTQSGWFGWWGQDKPKAA